MNTAAFGGTRKLSLFLLMAACAVFFTLFFVPAPQSSADDLSNVALVTKTDKDTKEESSKFFDNFNEAWAYAKEVSGTMYLLKDWTTSEALTVGEEVKVTLDLQGHMINRNNVDPSDQEYASDSGNDGSVFILEEKAELTITSDVDAYEHNGDIIWGGRFWHYNKNGSTPIYGGLITGGATDSQYGGGGIVVKESAKLVMTGVTVAGNLADRYGAYYGYGGAIALRQEHASAELTNCNLMYNFAQGGGGAVSIWNTYSSFKMSGGCISNNYTKNYGGGIYVDYGELDRFGEGAVTVKLPDTEVSNNYAEEDGGGIFLGGLGPTVTGGKITGNIAGESGGGVYVYREDCGLDGCTITNNEAGERGGGVLLENDNTLIDGTPALKLGGTLVIKDNKANNAKSNLLLRNSYALTKAAKIYGVPSQSSEIWISTEEDGVISWCADSYNDAVFYTDNENKIVWWETNSSDDNYRFLKIGNASDGHSKAGYVANKVQLKASETSQGEGNLQETSYDYNGYPVYRGYSMEDRLYLLNAYYYSDGYFMESATNYNEHLATFAYHLACSAMNSSVTKDSRGYKREWQLQASHAKQTLSDLGVAEDDIFLSDTYFEKPSSDSIACSIGSKELKNKDGDDSGVTLVMINVRGQGYDSEWASNVTLGGENEDGTLDGDAEHAGFASAADQIMDEWLNDYLADRGLDEQAEQGNVRFLVTGFSRAAAVSNLLSKRIIDKYEDPAYVGDNHVVFGYTYESPQGGNYAQVRDDRSYNGIHNSVLSGDLVARVAMSTMNFQRYGVDHYLGGSAAGTASADVITGEGAESEGQAKRYSVKYAGWLSHKITLNSDGKLVEDTDDWTSTHFMKDNDYYVVGSDEYEKAKVAMLKQLAASNNTIFFDDYFHLATLSFTTDQFTGYTKEVGNDSVKLTNYLDDFMFYANAWLINEGNLQNRPARLHYVKEFKYGDYYASDEDVARDLVVALYLGTVNFGDLAGKFTSSDTLSDLWSWVNTDWSKSSEEPDVALSKLLTKHGIIGGEDGLPITEGQASALINMLINVLSGDWDNVSEYMAGTSVDYGTDDYLVMSGTLLYNINRIMLNHKVDVVCAWMRSVDSYYTDESDANTSLYNVSSATDDEVKKPYLTMKVNGEEVTVKAGETLNLFKYDHEKQPTVTDIQLHTEDCNAGGMVYYTYGDGTVADDADEDKDGFPEYRYKGYKYFDSNSTKLFEDVTDWSKSQKITAHTAWYNTPSEDATFTILYQKDPNINSVYVNGELFGTFTKGDSVVVPLTPEDDCHVFASCELENSDKGYIPTGEWWSTPNNETLEFEMPGGDVYWKIGYRQKQVADPEASPNQNEYEDSQYIEFTTPSGTADDGFSVSYTYEAYTNGGDARKITGEGEGGITVCTLDDKQTYWIIYATAKYEGWADSETKKFIVHVNPAEKTYSVDVLNGTLVEDGEATDKSKGIFKAGDTVTVTASQDNINGWECDPEDLVKSDCKDKTVTFTMPSKDVVITAILPDAVVETPTASLASGDYVGTQTVELSCGTEGAEIYYTTDGQDPDENSTLYKGPIEVSGSMTLKVKAYHEGMTASEVAEYQYKICHTVTFDSAGGSDVNSQTVEAGGTATEPDPPTNDGFAFEGWFLEDGTAYDFSTPVNDDLTLYAKWSASGEPSHEDGDDDDDDSSDSSDDSGQDEGDNSGSDKSSSSASSSSGSDSESGDGVPGTGDDAMAPVVPVALLIASFALVAVSMVLRRRRA